MLILGESTQYSVHNVSALARVRREADRALYDCSTNWQTQVVEKKRR